MAGTNVGAVYLDLRLNVQELQRGFAGIERDVGALGGVFESLQGNLLRWFSNEGFAPIFQAFGDMGDGMNPVKSGLGLLSDGFDGLIERVPVLSRFFGENVARQIEAEEAMADLAGRTSLYDQLVGGLTDRLNEMPFGFLQEGALSFGEGIDELGERSRIFGQNWRDVMLGARADAEQTGGGFNAIFGGDIPAMWQRMLGDMEGGWSNAWTGMKQAFHGIINRIVGGINNMISGLNRFQVNLPSWMGGGSFGFNIPQIPQIPALARGGIVDAPTLALVGERGREAVLPLENNTGWMADLANMVAGAVAGNAPPQQGAAGVNLYLDGVKVAEGIIL